MALTKPILFLLFTSTLLTAAQSWNATEEDDHYPMTDYLVPYNLTRRTIIEKYHGPCKPTNPIDKCWRCNPKWAQNRKKITDCIIGFGKGTTGGRAGRYYVVTDPSDNDVINPRPGTLRHAVIQKEPLWIYFARSMTIKLQKELIMQSHKTIDGRGAQVHIANGAGFMIQYVQNVIIHNLFISDIVSTSGGLIRDSVDHYGLRGTADGDGVSIFGSSNIWLDHLSMRNCADGLIDAVEGSTKITISNCHWTDHDKALLFGASDKTDIDSKMRITVAYNHFGKRLVQRMPRVRGGIVHVINNDYTHWNKYAIGGSHGATVISQGNRFIAPMLPELKEVTHRDAPEWDWKRWSWCSQGDIFARGAFFRSSGDCSKGNIARLAGMDAIYPRRGRAVKSMTRFAGYLGCRPGVAC